MSNRGAKRASMPCKKEIYDYWAERIDGLDEDRYNFGPLKDHYCCFACGSYHRIERAHIVPLCDGGTNDVSNLHLLCAMCHIDSEMLVGDLYSAWLARMRDTSPTVHDTRRYERRYGPDWMSHMPQVIEARKSQPAPKSPRRRRSQREREAIMEGGNA